MHLQQLKKTNLSYCHDKNLNLVSNWMINVRYMANLELSTARAHRAKPETVAAWGHFVCELSELLRGS